jgi:hypothetical protein
MMQSSLQTVFWEQLSIPCKLRSCDAGVTNQTWMRSSPGAEWAAGDKIAAAHSKHAMANIFLILRVQSLIFSLLKG